MLFWNSEFLRSFLIWIQSEVFSLTVDLLSSYFTTYLNSSKDLLLLLGCCRSILKIYPK